MNTFRQIAVGLVLAMPLLPSQASAASRVWIAEFVAQKVQAAAPFATLPSLVIQPPLDISIGRAASMPFAAQTRYIRIVCEVQCALTMSGAAATVNDILLPALKPEYFGVQPGRTISVISAP
jgi:hypothetical protein